MNMSVASTGQCPSQPPRTTRARWADAGMKRASVAVGTLRASDEWAGLAPGADHVLEHQLVDTGYAVATGRRAVDVVLLECGGVGAQRLPGLIVSQGRHGQLADAA